MGEGLIEVREWLEGEREGVNQVKNCGGMGVGGVSRQGKADNWTEISKIDT